MNLFGRKSAGRASARPALARAFSWNVSDIPRSYEAQVRAAMLENPVAQRAVRMVSEAVGGAPLSGNDDALTGLVTTTSAGQSLLESVAAQLLLHGNGYIQILCAPDGTPRELFALRPERVSVEGDARGWPVAYNYRANGATARLPADSVIHIKAMHPLDDHYGLGCLGAASGAVAIHNAATLWNKALLDNAARPSGALVHEASEALSADQFDRLQSELAASFSGGGNAGRPMLLEGGLRWQSLSLSPADMDFAGLKAAAAREIALAFGVPPMLLGLPGDATYSNYREANRALWRQTVLPLTGKILAAVRQGLVGNFPEAVLEVDLDRVTELSEDRERLWVMVGGAGFLTLDEKREMVGLGPLGPDVAPASPEMVPTEPVPDTTPPKGVKYNHNHDPANGQFTFVTGGGGSRAAGGALATAGSLAISNLRIPKPTQAGSGVVIGDPANMAKRPVVPINTDPRSGAQTFSDGHIEVATKLPVPGIPSIGNGGIDIIAKYETFQSLPYVPNKSIKSGVTIGYGYDLGGRTAATAKADLILAGLDEKSATALASAARLTGTAARTFVSKNSSAITISKGQAKALFKLEFPRHAANVLRLVKVPLSQNQYDALISLDYTKRLTPSSDIVKYLAKRDYESAASEFKKFKFVTMKHKNGKHFLAIAPGLVNRRAEEEALFRKR